MGCVIFSYLVVIHIVTVQIDLKPGNTSGVSSSSTRYECVWGWYMIVGVWGCVCGGDGWGV